MSDPSPEFKGSVFLLDGSALAYRAYHAFERASLSSPKGLPTGAILGFTNEITAIASKARPGYAAVVFDRPEPTFRHEIYADYKATRDPMPEALVVQLPWMRQVAEALGFRVFTMPGFEADDVIGTFAKRAEAEGHQVFIVTGDKDFMQLVGEKIKIYALARKGDEVKILGVPEVHEKFGVLPHQVIDVLGLMGDASDNIPGIPSVGAKGAPRMIAAYGSLEALLQNPGPEISPRIRQNLIEHRESGLLSKRLATIDINVPLMDSIESLAFGGPKAEIARELFLELGFRTYAEQMSSLLAPKIVAPHHYTIIRTKDELDALLLRLEAAPLIAVDTETTGLDPRVARIVGFSFGVAVGVAFYVPLNSDPPIINDPAGTAKGQGVVEALRPFLEDPRKRKCGQNVKYDLMVMRNHGIEFLGVVSDTMIAAYLLEPEERERNLDALSLRHFGYKKIKTEELIGKGKDQITMDLVPVDVVGNYACEDADFTYRLAERFLPRLADDGVKKLHDEVEIPLINVLADMQAQGVRVDRERLRSMARDLEREVTRLEEEIFALAGRKFTIGSPKQLGELLFDELKIHLACDYRPKKTKIGYATGVEVLEELTGHPLPAKILEYRSFTKLLSTYILPLPDLVDPDTGCIHTSYNQTVAATGRLSSSDPNLQNIPIRTEIGRKIREAFLPSDTGFVLLSADYSQVELRILAALSKDEVLVNAFKAGADIHRDTAARVFGVSAESVDAGMRSRAKAINFGILYGMGAQRLARETELSLDEAKGFIERYFAAFPRVKEFISALKDQARERGFVQTVLGRRRPIPDINSDNGMLRAAAENMAVNTPIQGSAADILKVAMVAIHRRLRDERLRSRLILTVHDELVLDVPEAEVDVVTHLVRSEMEGASPLDVPLKVDMGVGRNWLEAH